MPIYEYVCAKCSEELEVLQKISDPAPEKCPACGAAAMSRKVSAAAFRLKGGGWYETDFKSEGKRNLASDSADSGSAKNDADTGAKRSGDSGVAAGSASETSAKKADTATAPAKEKPAKSSPAASNGSAGKG